MDLNSYINFDYSVDEVKFVRPLSDIKLTSLEGQMILECELTKSDLKVDWTKEGKPIKKNGVYDIIVEGKVHKLVVAKTSIEQIGKYTVTYQKLNSTANVTLSGISWLLLRRI